MAIDTTKRIALYPGRSGLPGATLQAIVDQEGGGGGDDCIGQRSFSQGDSEASLTTTGAHPAVKGTGRNWFFAVYSMANVASPPPVVQTVTFDGQVFDDTFRIGAAVTPGNNQAVALWRIEETDLVGSVADVEAVPWTVTTDLDTGISQTVVKCFQLDIPVTGFTFASVTEFDAVGGPFSWPVSQLLAADFGMVVFGAIDPGSVVITDPADTARLDTQVVSGTGVNKSWHSNIFPPSANGDTTGTLIRFAMHLFLTAD